MMANIFAYWTLDKSEHYFESLNLKKKDVNSKSYLYMPHAA